jgi:hypothetical protein
LVRQRKGTEVLVHLLENLKLVDKLARLDIDWLKYVPVVAPEKTDELIEITRKISKLQSG